MTLKLFAHQELALRKTENQNRVAYYLDMGLGKTFVGSEKLSLLNNNTNLVVCQKSKINDWLEHFKKYYDYEIYDLTKKNDFLTSDKPKVGVINYDLIYRRNEFLNLENFTLLLDESSLIQNDKAKRTKFILKLKPSNVILLSGTPTSGRYENLFSQVKLLGWDIKKTKFNERYVNWRRVTMGKMAFWQVDKINPYKNVDELKEKLREHGAVFIKTEECFDLPQQQFIEVHNDNTRYYKEFLKTRVITIDGEELIGDNTLKANLYARWLSSYLNPNRLRTYQDLINSTNDRLIVFYNFKKELEILKELSKDKPISIVNGDVKDLTAYEHEDNSITFVQYQAGAMGLNLQKANKIIYFSLTNKSELFEQSKKRIHRIGQNQPCTYYLLLSRGTLEPDILERLKKREDYNNELFR